MARWYALTLLFVLVGCQQSTPANLLEIERKIDALQKEVDSLNKVVEEHGIDLAMVEIEKHHSAMLTLGASGSATLPTDAGTVWLRLIDVEPVGASSRITLSFGNTGAATLSKISMNLRWRKTDGEDFSAPKLIDQVVTMAPGAWSKMKIVVETAPANIGQIAITDLAVSQVGLFGKL